MHICLTSEEPYSLVTCGFVTFYPDVTAGVAVKTAADIVCISAMKNNSCAGLCGHGWYD